MNQCTTMALFYLMYLFVAVRAYPVHQLEGEALDVAERNGFLSDDYNRLHVIKLSENLSGSLHSLDLGRIRMRRETQEKIKLIVPINGVNYSLSLEHPNPVLHKNAKIIVANGSNSEELHNPWPRSCYLVGGFDDQPGSASLSYCDKLRGVMLAEDTEYILEPLNEEQYLLAERKKPEASLIDSLGYLNNDEDLSLTETGYSGFWENDYGEDQFSEPVIIELAVYCDADMTKLLEDAKANTIQKKVDYIISKFNGVQYEYSKIKQLKQIVIFQIKKMVFYKTNPDWLNVKGRLGLLLSPFCRATSKLESFDVNYLITGHKPMSPVGLSFLGGTCLRNFRCAVSIGTSWGRYAVIVHEIGHLLGMRHDYSTNCRGLPYTELGIMGGKGTDFSTCSAESFNHFLKQRRAKCLFTQNVPDQEVMPELRDSVLEDIPSVWNLTHHQYCENLMGPGYRYREREGMKYSCERGYYCVQLKKGPDFGLIYEERAKGIVGMYCAPGKVCLKGKCLTYKLMTLHSEFLVRAGGWSPWSNWTSCSRTCGTGVMYSHRECNNPSPIQHKYCEGNEYKAVICNTQPCPDDPSKTYALIKSRADETCKRLVQGNFFNPTIYYKSGRVYGQRGYDNVCDVHCNNKVRRYSRDAILPDGTPCSYPDPEFGISTRKNVHMHCFRGKCQMFGCKGNFPAKFYGSNPECQSEQDVPDVVIV